MTSSIFTWSGSKHFSPLIREPMTTLPFDTFHIGGIKLHVYGLAHAAAAAAAAGKDEGSAEPPVACRVIFCTHGRQSTLTEMDEMCRAYCSVTGGSLPIVAVTFDHRNHGDRAVGYDLGNVGWPTAPGKEGNPMHAVDMYAIQHGTAQDISFLIDHLPAAFEVDGRVRAVEWGVSGISLGGHSSLLAVMNDPRISFAIPIVGCGDYETLMRDRHAGILARHPSTDLVSWPKAFPPSLQMLVHRVDPVHRVHVLSAERSPASLPRILFIGGGQDKLVPVTASNSFWTKLVQVYQAHAQQRKLTLEVDGEAAHECSAKMAETACQWLSQC